MQSNEEPQLETDELEIEIAQQDFEQQVLDKLIEEDQQMDECQMYMLVEDARANQLIIEEGSYLTLWYPDKGFVDEKTGEPIDPNYIPQNQSLTDLSTIDNSIQIKEGDLNIKFSREQYERTLRNLNNDENTQNGYEGNLSSPTFAKTHPSKQA